MIELDVHKQLQTASGKLDAHFQGNIAFGKCIALYGASGVGKTSLLRILAGLLTPEKGTIIVGNDVWFDAKKKVQLSPQQRSIGLVFQDYALFPHLTVEANLYFARTKKQSNAIIEELLDITELQQLRKRRPAQLSGGQQQRVALARALVQQPQLLLLDEPLAALDEAMRQKLRDLLQRLRQQYHHTTILVSHDREDVLQLADEVWVMEEGRIEKRLTPSELFGRKGEELIGKVIKMERMADGKWLITLQLAKGEQVQIWID